MSAMRALASEGRADAAVLTGNAMIATLVRTRPGWLRRGVAVPDRMFGLLTLHRG